MKNLYGESVCIIAPHPDDEVLGLGGSISKMVNSGIKVNLLVVSGHLPPLYPESSFETTKEECMKSAKVLGINNVEFAKIPATYIHNEPISKLNNIIQNFIFKHCPHSVFIPFPDRHIDHRTVFDSSVVCCRPNNNFFPKVVLAYETLSETHWNVPGIEPAFTPEFFVDITNYIDKKKEALSCYQSQLENNQNRSVEASMSLAKFRGSQNGCGYAEAFKVVRIVV